MARKGAALRLVFPVMPCDWGNFGLSFGGQLLRIEGGIALEHLAVGAYPEATAALGAALVAGVQ